jgi:hypothetical protein
LKDFFSSSEESCLQCPEGTSCDVDGNSTLEDLFLQPGWWRISASTDEIHRCPHGLLACRGGLAFQAGYCTDGHQGVLCAVCADDYFFDTGEATCLSCNDLPGLGELWLSSPPLISFSVLCAIFFGFVVKISCASNLEEINKRMQQSKKIEQHVERITGLVSFAKDIMSQVKGGQVKLKALTSFFQIAQNIGVRLETQILANLNSTNA